VILHSTIFHKDDKCDKEQNYNNLYYIMPVTRCCV